MNDRDPTMTETQHFIVSMHDDWDTIQRGVVTAENRDMAREMAEEEWNSGPIFEVSVVANADELMEEADRGEIPTF